VQFERINEQVHRHRVLDRNKQNRLLSTCSAHHAPLNSDEEFAHRHSQMRKARYFTRSQAGDGAAEHGGRADGSVYCGRVHGAGEPARLFFELHFNPTSTGASSNVRSTFDPLAVTNYRSLASLGMTNS